MVIWAIGGTPVGGGTPADKQNGAGRNLQMEQKSYEESVAEWNRRIEEQRKAREEAEARRKAWEEERAAEAEKRRLTLKLLSKNFSATIIFR